MGAIKHPPKYRFILEVIIKQPMTGCIYDYYKSTTKICITCVHRYYSIFLHKTHKIMNLVNNWVKVSGIDIDDAKIDSSYGEEKHMNLYLTVEAIGVIGDLPTFYAQSYRVNPMVKVGDVVLCRWYDVQEAWERKSDLIPYDGIVGIVRDGVVVPINDNVIYESSGGGVHPESGKVTAVSTDVIDYLGYDGTRFKPMGINIGDYILCTKYSGRELEHLFHQKLSTKQYVVQSKDIILTSNERIRHGE
jgi:co-chaperonin GroES (HSP10)